MSEEAVWIGSFGTLYKVRGEATHGSVAVVEHVLAPRSLGAPLHLHTREDETSYVLEGELAVQIGETVRTLRPGSIVLKPRGAAHTFWNPGDAPVRFLEIISPAGFERYFQELASIIPAEGPPNMAAIAALGARYGVEFDFASLPGLLEAHGLKLG